MAALRSLAPDILVAEAEQPGMTIEVLSSIRREHPRIRIVLLTGRGSNAYTPDAADVCLSKPFESADLLAVVRKQVRR